MRARTVLAAGLLLCVLPGAAAAEDPAPRPVDALIDELGSQFGKNREQAARDLGLHGPAAAKAVPALVNALKDAFVPARLSAAVSLSQIDPSEMSGVPVLIESMGSGPDESRLEAFRALTVYPADTPGLVAAFLRCEDHRELASPAFRHLVKLGKGILPEVRALLARGDPQEIRKAWIHVSGLGLDCVPDLVRLLESKDEATRRLAADLLGKELLPKYPAGIGGAARVLIEQPSSAPAFPKAVETLAAAGDAALPALLGILVGTEEPRVRVNVILALDRLGAAARPAVGVLRTHASSIRPEVREAALAAIWKLDPDAMKGPHRFPAERAAWAAAREAKTRTKGLPRGTEIEDSLARALDWLVAHQEKTGLWAAGGSRMPCRRDDCGGGGHQTCDTGVSALAVLALLGDGSTHATGKRAEPVRRGLEALVAAQDAEGCIGPRSSPAFIFGHAIGLLALADGALATGDPDLRTASRRGAAFALACRNPYMAWRYGVRPQDNDTAVTGWMVFALRAAEAGAGPLEDVAGAYDGAKTWLDKVTEPEYGRAGYAARGHPSPIYEGATLHNPETTEGLTALAVVTRLLAGADVADEYPAKGRELCLAKAPVYDVEKRTIDFHYWHFASMALLGGPPDPKSVRARRKWQAECVEALVDNQRLDKSRHDYGSWDPVDPWSFAGGRVYATAINALTLETPWRYPKEWFEGTR
jgi:hypothetical protein